MPEPAPCNNAPRPAPRFLRRGVLALCVLAVVLALAVAALWAFLPRLIEDLAVPEAATRLNLPGLRADVRRLDFSGLDLGEISLGPGAGVSVAAVQADWSLAGLMDGRLDRVRIMGLRVRAVEENGVWTVPGLPRAEGGGDGPAMVPHIADLAVDGVVEIDGAALGLTAPFSLDGRIDEHGVAAVEVRTELAGQPLRLALGADLARRDFRLTCALPPASVAALGSLVPGLRDLPVSGSLEALLDAALPPDGAPTLRTELNFAALQAVTGAGHVAQDGNASMRLHWADPPTLTLDPLRLTKPLPLVLTIGVIDADPVEGALDCTWDLTLAGMPGLDLAAPLRLSGQTSVRRTPRGFDLRTRGGLDPVQAGLPGMPDLTAVMDKSAFSLDISASGTATRLDASLQAGRLRATRAQASAALSGLTLTVNATSEANATKGQLTLSGARLEARQPGLTLASTRLDGECSFDIGDRTSIVANLAAGFGARSGDTAAVVNLRLPLAWPEPSARSGSLATDVSWKKRAVAKISSRIAQNLHGFTLDGTLTVPPAGIRAALKGLVDTVRPEATWLEISADQRLDLPGDLVRFVPALDSLSGDARLEATARLDMSRGVPALPTVLKLTDMTLAHEKAKAVLQGGSLGLAFSDLLTTRSDPDQRMAFERLQLGTVILDKGDLRFQVESPKSLLVENCGFRWAGGRIGTQAFRIDPGVEDYTVEMYCDRVQLAQALSQLGMTQASGGGTANGRIPVRWDKGALTFDNGFLYSTPGEKGVLHIQGTEILTAGVPPGTPQYGQLDLASEALKDFAYEWAKVNLNTEGRELIVSLQLDGKPEKALPFVYDRDIGGFARVSASSPGSVFQGIRLDVNFRLPLDQLLQYRQLLELMNNGG